MLIIEIALGIVLGWLIINHFDAVVETLLFIIGSIIRAIFFPFKLLKNVAVNTFQFVTQNFIKIVQFFAILTLVFGGIYFGVELVTNLTVMGYEAVPKSWKQNAPTVVIIGFLILGILVFLKDVFVFLFRRRKNTDVND